MIPRDTFDRNYNLEEYGIRVESNNDNQTVYKTSWKGLAKKDGIINGDVITEFKVENLDRPNKAIVHPFALLILSLFGYLNYKRGHNTWKKKIDQVKKIL